ncbi:MAG: hypothetical protein K8S23_09110 [Candidatus Cloacimonetes bacterium]|nr:hypothetical protein [Candidatus Cloacimonadota bacterium]
MKTKKNYFKHLIRYLLIVILILQSLLSLSGCNDENATTEPDSEFLLKTRNSSVQPFESIIIENSGTGIFNNPTYNGVIDAYSIEIYRVGEKTLTFLLPHLSDNQYTLSLNINGSSYDCNVSVSFPPPIPDPQAYVEETAMDIENTISIVTSFADSISNLINPVELQTCCDFIQSCIDSVAVLTEIASPEELAEVVLFLNANQSFFDEILSITYPPVILNNVNRVNRDEVGDEYIYHEGKWIYAGNRIEQNTGEMVRLNTINEQNQEPSGGIFEYLMSFKIVKKFMNAINTLKRALDYPFITGLAKETYYQVKLNFPEFFDQDRGRTMSGARADIEVISGDMMQFTQEGEYRNITQADISLPAITEMNEKVETYNNILMEFLEYLAEEVAGILNDLIEFEDEVINTDVNKVYPSDLSITGGDNPNIILSGFYYQDDVFYFVIESSTQDMEYVNFDIVYNFEGMTTNSVSVYAKVVPYITGEILSPFDGIIYGVGESVFFNGNANINGNPIIDLIWTSSIDGQIGTGTSFYRSDLSPGVHTFTLEAGLDYYYYYVDNVQSLIDGEIYFPDQNFEQAVREVINKPTGPILISDVWQIQVLDIEATGINNFTGIEYFVKLKTLQIWGIDDLSIIANITQILYLDVHYNAISDISPLANLTQLTGLNLCANDISDISPLANLTQLTHLDLGSNDISDISPLADLTQLIDLDLRNSSSVISDISSLANLTELTYLHVGGNYEIIDISPLADLTQLTHLHLNGSPINDISLLANLTQLTFLYLSNCEISDISVMTNLTNLNYLHLQNNSVSDVLPLANLDQINYICLGENLVNDILPLVSNSGLSLGDELWLNLNPLSQTTIEIYIPQLEARGVNVIWWQ